MRAYLRDGALVTACVGDGGVPIDGDDGDDGDDGRAAGSGGAGAGAGAPLFGQSYALVDARTVPNFHGRRRLCLVCVRNAWAANGGEREQWEWRGAWSVGSDEWSSNHELARELSRAQASRLPASTTAHPAQASDGGRGQQGGVGAEWMAWADFVRCFNSIHVCGGAVSGGDASLRVDTWERDGCTHCAYESPRPIPTQICSAHHPVSARVGRRGAAPLVRLRLRVLLVRLPRLPSASQPRRHAGSASRPSGRGTGGRG